MDARHAAATVLMRVEEQGGFSNIVLEEYLQRITLSDADRALTVRLVYGVIERRLTLDYLLNHLSSVPVFRMEPMIREVLRIGAYQLVFADRIPAFAAVHESVELAKKSGFARLSGYVNGVLRAVERQGAAMLAALPDTDKGREIRYSCPREWIRAWRDAYGETLTAGLLESINDAPPVYLRVNTVKTDVTAFRAALDAAGVPNSPVPGLPEALALPSAALKSLPPQWDDCWYFQDIASQWCCRALDARPGERIADVCAAPGGKSFTVAQYMDNRGTVVASDFYEAKTTAMAARAAVLGLTCVSVAARDASAPPPDELCGTFDRVICDAPCSGLGVIRRKPEIRYKSAADFADLPVLQLRILEQAALLARPGGVLQYSTCTLRPEENENVRAAFLARHPEFSPRQLPTPELFASAGIPMGSEITLFPPIHASDGFYIAGFVRAGE